MKNVLLYPWRILCAIGRFLDSPEVPTKASKRNEELLLYFIILLFGVIFLIGYMLTITAPNAL